MGVGAALPFEQWRVPSGVAAKCSPCFRGVGPSRRSASQGGMVRFRSRSSGWKKESVKVSATEGLPTGRTGSAGRVGIWAACPSPGKGFEIFHGKVVLFEHVHGLFTQGSEEVLMYVRQG